MERTAALLAHWIAEAQTTLGLELRGIVPTAPTAWLFLFGEAGEPTLRARWLLVREAVRARFHLVPPRTSQQGERAAAEHDEAELAGTSPHLTPLLAMCRRAFVGKRLLRVEQPYRDKTIRFTFEVAHDQPTTLVAELFGAAPRFILLGGDDRVLAVEPAPKSGDRLLHGKRYAPPPSRGVDPVEGSERAPTTLPPVRADLDARTRAFADAHPWSFSGYEAYARLDRSALHRDRVHHLERATHVARQRAQDRLSQFEGDIAAGLDAVVVRQRADVLAANLHTVRAGMTRIELDDLYAEGRIVIELDPRLRPHENLARSYRQADKLERGAAYAAGQLAPARERLAALDELARDLHDALELEGIPLATLERYRELGIVRDRQAPALPERHAKAKDADLDDFKRFRLRSGIEAWVGGSDRANDRLTHHIARGNDIWMHVQSFHGAHVVLRLSTKRAPSLEDLLDGARLAVHFSKRRGHSAIVIYTQKKFVRKGRGKPGLAIVDRHQELRIDPDDSAIRALLTPDPE